MEKGKPTINEELDHIRDSINQKNETQKFLRGKVIKLH